jgi:hypothetical protein
MSVAAASAPEAAADRPRERVLDPVSRISEVLFGLIMALTFTCTLSVAEAGREEVRTLLFGAIGCNIAWGLVDAVMYLMNRLAERGRGLVLVGAVRDAATPESAHRIIADAVPPLLARMLTASHLETFRQGLLRTGDLPPTQGVTGEDLKGALAVFLLVFASTFPVVVPFLLFRSLPVAMRASNLVAIVMLFALGYALARHGGYRPWRTGLAMVALGIVLVGITIALGG